MPGSINRYITVSFEEPDAEPIMICLTGVVRAWAEASPQTLDFGKVLRTSRASKPLDVLVVPGHAWDSRDLKVNLAGLQLQLLSSREVVHSSDGAAGTLHRLEARYLSPTDARGLQAGEIRLNGPDQSKWLTIPVQATVIPALAAEPPEIFLGFIAPRMSAPVSVKIVINDDVLRSDARHFKIVHDLKDKLDVKLRPGASAREFQLEGTFRGQQKTGCQTGRIVVSEPRAGELTIPFSAYVR